MSRNLTVTVPDIGEFESVDVIEVLVAQGDIIAAEASLITLESDKATMEIPSPAAGVVARVLVVEGDQVSEGDSIVELAVADGAAAPEPPATPAERAPGAVTPTPSTPPSAGEAELHAEVLVLGGGPGGYTAAFRAADLGRRVVLVEREPVLGGVCLNVGCIPSKALLHVAEVANGVRALRDHGIDFGEPRLDLLRLRGRVDEVVHQLTEGLRKLARQRKVEVVQGTGRFSGPHRMRVEGTHGTTELSFDHAIIAAGSQPVMLPGLPDDPRIMDSTGALELAEVPERLLVIGGGIIGLELATVYEALGSAVTVVELLPSLMPGTDPELVRPLLRHIEGRYAGIHLGTRVAGIEASPGALRVSLDGERAPQTLDVDRVLVAVGRRPNGGEIGAEAAGVTVDPRGFVPVDECLRTNVPHIFAIGDTARPPMLAHKAMHEGKTAAEVIAGLPAAFEARTIPSVAYTDPEVAWMGLGEAEAVEQGVRVQKAVFPWAASGRALGMGRGEGLTKLLFDADTGRLLGAGIVGPHAGDLIAETVVALELGADAEDLGLSIHPHPTLSETVALAAEMATGTITDLYRPKKR